MTNRVVYFNGQFVAERAACISMFDSGLMYGDMAFEMTRTFHQQLFHLRDHLQRLADSLQFLKIDCGLSLDDLERLTRETLARNLPTEADDVDWHVRHDISRGPVELYGCTFPEVRPTVLISCWPLIKHMGRFAPLYDTGVDLVVSPQHALPASLLNPLMKTRSRVHFQLANLQAPPGAWPVLTDPQGFLAEGPSWNIFLVKNGELLSPDPRNILHGISREITIEAARRLGIPVRVGDFDRQTALAADEIVCTATSFGLVYARTFEGATVGNGQPGPIYRQLFEIWKEVVGLDFVAQARSYTPRVAEWDARERAAALA
ncbi:MAG TPA: aminotransferase class IV [Planctomycetaceae bacterium]|nr:aminotransferase class IV [Planctomycetaceae bacterium]